MRPSRKLLPAVWLTLLALLPVSLLAQAPPEPLRLEVDATAAARKIFHVRLEIPVRPGPLDLYYPEWIPGEHGPTGPIEDLIGLHFTANGRKVPWRRDLVEMYTFHLTIPEGVSRLQVELDYVNSAPASGFSSGASAAPHLAVLNWNQVLLYPAGYDFRQILYTPVLHLPAGWQFHTALPVRSVQGDTVEFATVPLNTLVDSPVQIGEYTRVVRLTDNPLHEIDIAADRPDELQMSPELERHYRQLVAETGALFGSRHYREYHFLLTLSDYLAHFGLEHHESSDDRTDGETLIDPQRARADITLLPHEFAHSWNGKYRRPVGLVTRNYQEPMKDDLLWVYEGLTQYLSFILSGRSGLCAPEDCREMWAYVAASLDHRPGRLWRPLQDTADAAPFLYNARRQWQAWRRGTDFYDEGALLWLEVDGRIRDLTQNQKSLDDFCRAFHGGPGGAPALKPYTFDDVVAALNAVAPYDWRTLLTERLTATGPHAPLGGLELGGWRLVYNDRPNARQRLLEEVNRELILTFSLGMSVDDDGTIRDVLPGMPAFAVGLIPDMRILAVNGRPWSRALLREAVERSAQNPAPITLVAVFDDQVQTFRLDYHGGPRYPHLERIPDRPDRLSDILRPHAPPVP
jgi:predicted metalloprotease with PDZ domain